MNKVMSFMFALLFGMGGYWTTEMNVMTTTDITQVIPTHWLAKIVNDAGLQELGSQLSGAEGSKACIVDKTGPLSKDGDYLNIQTKGHLRGAGRTGTSVLKSYEEKLPYGQYSVSCTRIRHAVAFDWLADKQSMVKQADEIGESLSDWLARYRDGSWMITARDSGANTSYANGAASAAALTSAGIAGTGGNNTFGANDLQTLYLTLLRGGAGPIETSTEQGRDTPVFTAVFGEVEEYYLSKDTALMQDLRSALAAVGQKGPIFKGALGMYHNMILLPYRSILSFKQGTALRPETVLLATLTTTATVVSVGATTVSTGTGPDFTKFFASTGTIQIDDEAMTYTSKTVNSFADVTRGAAGDAIQHVPGALVTQGCIATVIGLGAGAIARANGSNPKMIKQVDDYEGQNGLGIEAYFGNVVAEDSDGNIPGVALMKVYSPNPSGTTATV